ncbi:MAG: alpha/beta hydrolase [Chromatiales bacterium]|nr:MAG: alpha/beta hydrolase [Chromatiales bacterium]
MTGIPETVVPAAAPGHDFRLTAWQRDTGSEALLVMIHGLGCSKQSFAGAWSQTGFRDWSLLAPDLPGFGRAPKPADFSYDLQQQARVVASLLDQRASRRVRLVAHSMGGTLALLLPDRILSRLEALVLVEPRLLAESCSVAAEASRYPEEDFDSQFMQGFRRRVRSDPRVAFDAEHADPLAFQRSANSLVRWAGSGEMLSRFARLPCPAWFVYGADNRHLAELRHLPPHQTVAIPGAAHFPMHDNPDLFYATLAGLLDSAGPGRKGMPQ